VNMSRQLKISFVQSFVTQLWMYQHSFKPKSRISVNVALSINVIASLPFDVVKTFLIYIISCNPVIIIIIVDCVLTV